MKERRDSIAVRIADTIAGGVRRRQQGREPRALVYDAAGEPRLVPAASDEQRALLEAAEALVEIALEETAADGDARAEEAACAAHRGAAGLRQSQRDGRDRASEPQEPRQQIRIQPPNAADLVDGSIDCRMQNPAVQNGRPVLGSHLFRNA